MSGQYDPSLGLDISESRQPQVWVSLLIPYTLAFLTVVARFTSRRIARSGSWWDDWLIALAMMIATGTLAGTATAVQAGLGRHIWYFPVDEIGSHARDILLGLFELDNMYYGCYALAKLSVLALYWRTFKNKIIRRVVYLLVLVVILWMGVSVTLTVLECSPVSGFWEDPLAAYCPIPRIPLHVGLSIASAVVNVIILVIPIPLFLDPQHTKLHRFILALIFGFGLLVVGASIVRTLAVAYTDITNVDMFWNLTNAWAWTAVELYLAIVAANLPTLGHLVARFVPSLDSRSLSPAHTGSTDVVGQATTAAGEKKKSVRSERERDSGRQSSTAASKQLRPMAVDYDQYAANEKNLPAVPEAWFDAPEQPLPEREMVRQVDHGIAEWEFAPQPSWSPHPSHHGEVHPGYAEHAHPGMRIPGRWDGQNGEEAGIGAVPVNGAEFQPRQRSINFTYPYASPTFTYSSGDRHTSSYASEHGLLAPRFDHPANRRSSIAAPSWAPSSARSSGLVPPGTAIYAQGRHPHAYSLSADAAGQHGESSSSSSNSHSNGSPAYGDRHRGSWYGRGTATTPEFDWTLDDRARDSSTYSGPSFIQRVRGGQGYGHGHGPESGNGAWYGPVSFSVAPTSHPSPLLGPAPAPPLRNPRRALTGNSNTIGHSGAAIPDTVLATELTVTRVGPSANTTPQLQQGPFADGWRRSSGDGGGPATAVAAGTTGNRNVAPLNSTLPPRALPPQRPPPQRPPPQRPPPPSEPLFHPSSSSSSSSPEGDAARDFPLSSPPPHTLQTAGLAHSGGQWVMLSPPLASPADATLQLAALNSARQAALSPSSGGPSVVPTPDHSPVVPPRPLHVHSPVSPLSPPLHQQQQQQQQQRRLRRADGSVRFDLATRDGVHDDDNDDDEGEFERARGGRRI